MNYFKPIDLNGLQRFTESGEEPLWHRLNTPEASSGALDPLPGIVVPPDATGVLVQADADIYYGQCPKAAEDGTPAALKLPKGGTHFAPGREALSNLVFLLDGSANIVFQFYSGQLGPVPTIR